MPPKTKFNADKGQLARIASRSLSFRITTLVTVKQTSDYPEAIAMGAECAAQSIKEQFGFEVLPVDMIASTNRCVNRTPSSVTYELVYKATIEY